MIAVFRNSKGQSLIEVLGATTILVIVVLSLVAVNTRSVYNASFARDQALATQYAQAGAEKIRAYRDQGSWSDFTSACESILDAELPPPPFARTVDCYVPQSATDCSGTNDRCEVEIIVSWVDNHGSHQSQLRTRLTNWR